MKFGNSQKGKHHVSLHKFASRGSKGTQLQRKKEEDEVKRHKKSAALRKYAKLCKRDGINSDRVNLDNSRGRGNAAGGTATASDDDKPSLGKRPTAISPHKSQHPFVRAERTAQEAKDAKLQSAANREMVQKDIAASQKVRNEKRQLHLKRTRTGQPVLNNTVKSLLAKIQAQQ